MVTGKFEKFGRTKFEVTPAICRCKLPPKGYPLDHAKAQVRALPLRQTLCSNVCTPEPDSPSANCKSPGHSPVLTVPHLILCQPDLLSDLTLRHLAHRHFLAPRHVTTHHILTPTHLFPARSDYLSSLAASIYLDSLTFEPNNISILTN